MPKTREASIFQKGSTTYYWSSQFFPPAVREDVFKLYSFVRVADNYVDQIPQDSAAFQQLRTLWEASISDQRAEIIFSESDTDMERVVKNMVYVTRRYAFDIVWVTAFLDAMQMDLQGRSYRTIDEVLEYVYGSAEVIGLMMARIMSLPNEATEAARLQGRAMQWINFLRDISEDNRLQRCYIPQDDLRQFGLDGVTKNDALAHPDAFKQLMAFELERYKEWQTGAYEGFRHIPRRLRIPLKTAVDMYNWTARRIADQPMLIFEHRIKPTPPQVVATAAKNVVLA